MKSIIIQILFVCIFTIIAFADNGNKQPANAKHPGPKDKCPVCGMFVAKYPGFLTQIQFNDNTAVFFDGPKDLFKYYRSIGRYNTGKKISDIGKLFATDYYSQQSIDGYVAVYVTGSDITGPMGKELVPFKDIKDAEEFKKDHNGSAILGFKDITDKILESLDK